MTKSQSYPEYKETGLKWLGRVPVSWDIVPLWTLYSRGKTTGFPDEELLSVYRDHGVVPKGSRDDNFNKPSDDLSAYQLVKPGDMVINKMKAWQGSVAISRHRGIVSPAYFVYERHHGMDDRYLHYLLRSERYITGYLSLSKGIRTNQWDLDPTYHSRMPVLVPSMQEQRDIVDLLDRETAQIENLIGKQERLIELLAEKRQAIITHIVTQGLDPAAPTKSSGVPWQGPLPEHWRVQPLKNLMRMQTGVTLGKDFSDVETQTYAYLRVANVQIGHVDLSDVKEIDLPREVAASSMLQPGDVLMTEGGDRDKLARGCIWDASISPCVHQNHIFAVRTGPQLLSSFLVLVLDADPARTYFYLTGKQSTNLASTNSTTVKNFRFGVPPMSEQLRIVDHLKVKTLQMDELTEKAKAVISTLKEHRSALISAAVTGKVDLRSKAKLS